MLDAVKKNIINIYASSLPKVPFFKWYISVESEKLRLIDDLVEEASKEHKYLHPLPPLKSEDDFHRSTVGYCISLIEILRNMKHYPPSSFKEDIEEFNRIQDGDKNKQINILITMKDNSVQVEFFQPIVLSTSPVEMENISKSMIDIIKLERRAYHPFLETEYMHIVEKKAKEGDVSVARHTWRFNYGLLIREVKKWDESSE